MNDDLHNVNDVLGELEGLAIKTSAGEYVKMEDVRRLIEKRQVANQVTEKETPKPKTLEGARALAKAHLKDAFGDSGLREPGRSVSANESHSSSRT